MARRKWIKISVESLLSDIAWKEANGYDFEARTLKVLIKMTPKEKETYKMFLDSCKAAKKRREEGYPDPK